MKRILLFAALLISFASFSQGQWRPGEMEIRATIHSQDEALALSSLHFNGDIYTAQGYALLYLTPEELESFKAIGLEYEVTKQDLNAYYKDFWNNRDAYHTYDEIIQIMNTLAMGHPDICKKYDLGLSVEGRLLSALKISDNAAVDENEPEVMFDGGIHGDEIGGPENLIRFAQFLCNSYGTDPDITDLIDNREIWLYVMVNPDGRVNMIRYNSHGIDVNRDWGYMWNAEGGSPGYYSQVETKTLRDCMLDNQFVVHTSYHSGTEFLSYPWSYRPNQCPDHDHIDYLASIYSSTSGYTNLTYAQGYQGMYPINGSSKDAYYGVMGSVGWTIEISNSKQPPTSQIQHYYEINQPAMLAIIDDAAYGISGMVTDAITGDPVQAIIFVDDFFPTYNDPVVGDYHKYLLAGTYEVKVAANGYQELSQTVTVTSNSTTTTDFALQPEYNHYAYRVDACYIPDNNFDDEGTTFASLWAPDGVRYSIGRSGWVILDMGETINDGPGSEIRVYEEDNDPEGYSCFASMSVDGPWTFLGTGTGSANFNFTPANVTQARFIRIDDDGNGPATGNNAGFDLDAVGILEQPQVVSLEPDAWISDPLGNNNGRIDPGESCELMVKLRNNGGLTAQGVTLNLNYDSAHVTFLRTDTIAGNLAHGDEVVVSFPLNCSMLTPLEDIVMMVLNVTANGGTYSHSFPMHFTVGAIIEDWETGNFNKFDWTPAGTKAWAINFLYKYEGAYSAKSGSIDNSQTSGMQVIFNVIGYDDISFYRKVSSEEGMDFLKFYIDDVMVDQWSGDQDWEWESYDVTPGTHTFRWSYEKNDNLSLGLDGGWIDYIVFPSSNLSGELKAIANALPHEFCGQGNAQLGAYVTGGSSPYAYSWTPAATLNNPAIQFPVATPDVTTLYTVTVNDGTEDYSSNIGVTVNPVPETPVVAQEGDSLVSTAVEGNQWYDVNGVIEGATAQVFYPEAEGDYYVIVTSEAGCISDPSEPVHFLFTGIGEEGPGRHWLVYPNPVSDNLYIRKLEGTQGEATIRLVDLTGREIFSVSSGVNETVTIPASHLPGGIYILEITDKENKAVLLQKIAR